VGEQVVAGVILIVQKHREIIRSLPWLSFRFLIDTLMSRSQTEWNLFFAIIRSNIPHSEGARMSFDFITTVTTDGPDQLITGDNFVGLVTVLDDFATVAGISTESKQAQGRRNEPLNSSKCVGYAETSCQAYNFQFLCCQSRQKGD